MLLYKCTCEIFNKSSSSSSSSSSSRSVDMNVEWSFRWLRGSLHSESESTIFAIQDQVICTRIYQAKAMKSSISSMLCRFCGD